MGKTPSLLAAVLCAAIGHAAAQPCEPSFRSSTPLDFIAPPYGVVGAFDFNRDGRKDLLFGGPHSMNVALGAGQGSFGQPMEAIPFHDSVAVGDMDGDGILDLVAIATIAPSSSSIDGPRGRTAFSRKSRTAPRRAGSKPAGMSSLVT